MKVVTSFFIILLSFVVNCCFGQGSALLIQQYNKGPALDNRYSKWSLLPRLELNRFNTDRNSTKSEFTLGGRFGVEYRLQSTFGIESGVGYTPVSYNYIVEDSLGIDRLEYLTVPLGVKLHPTSRISVGLGANYNFYQKGVYRIIKEGSVRIEDYPLGVFTNTLGGFLRLEYHFLWGGTVSLNYRWATRASPPLQSQTNSSSGFQLGMAHTLWQSKLRR